MGLRSWVRYVLGGGREPVNGDVIETISVLKTETPEKIIETKIKPVKIPTIVDIGERLGLILRDISDLKFDMVTKSWFKSEYENIGDEVIKRLEDIRSNLNSFHDSLNQLNRITKELSNNLSNRTKMLSKPLSFPERGLGISDKILRIIQENKKIRYKDISIEVNVSEPTLCKHLKNLLRMDKITKTKEGKAVYYEPL